MVRHSQVKRVTVNGGPRNFGHQQHRRRNQHRVIEISYQLTDVILFARAVCESEKVNQFNEHASVVIDIRIPSDDRQYAAEQDANVKDARQPQTIVF